MSGDLATPSEGPLAIICGGGALPMAVAEYVAARGRKVVLFPLVGAADGASVGRYQHHWLYIGQIHRFISLARAAGCREVIFIGALVRPSIWRTRPGLRDLLFVHKSLVETRCYARGQE